MVHTFGLTHIALAVRDVARSSRFYQEVPGEPYLFAFDPDGYEFEIWYELPTSVDPPRQDH
jgi:catechol 2,3-dioxygenase-like lactoylglutathione lyase family enzyme